MPRTLSIALWSLGGLGAAITAALLFLTVAGDDFYRWAMRQAIAGTIGREVRAEGSFSFRVGLRPTLTVTDVWMENAPWTQEKELARAGRIEVQIALWPLLSGTMLIPRLVVEDLVLDLETSPDGEPNWDILSADTRGTGGMPGDPFYPLFGFISFKDISVTHKDHRSGLTRNVRLHYLTKTQAAEDESFEIDGAGDFNRRPFKIKGRYGSIQQAMTAAEPYPFELHYQAPSLAVSMKGTAQRITSAEGFNVRLEARSPSIEEVLSVLEIDHAAAGELEATAQLRGDLRSLTLEEIDLEIIGRSGERMQLEGRIADIVDGTGMELRISGDLEPEALWPPDELPPGLREVLHESTLTELGGSITGEFKTPVFEDLRARMEHPSGGTMSLRGGFAIDFSEEGDSLAASEFLVEISLPDEVILGRALNTTLPEVGPIALTADLAWADDRIVLRSAEMEVDALAPVRVNASGEIGQLSARDLTYQPSLAIDLSGSSAQSRPVVYLLEQFATTPGSPPTASSDSHALSPQEHSAGTSDNLVLSIQHRLKASGFDPVSLDGKMGPRTRAAIEGYQTHHGLTVDGHATAELLQHLRENDETAREISGPKRGIAAPPDSPLANSLPEIGPVEIATRMTFEGGAYRFDNLNATIGNEGNLWFEAAGTLGIHDPENDTPLEDISVAVKLNAESSQPFAQFLPPKTPDLRTIEGQFKLRGSTRTIAVSDGLVTAQGPDGLVLSVKGGLAEASFAPSMQTRGLGLEVEARWPQSEGISQLIGIELPDLGPVQAGARLVERGEGFSLEGLDLMAGDPAEPAVRMSGTVGDLLAIKEIALEGEFEIPTADLLATYVAPTEAELGNVHGSFDLSDRDGSIGLEALSAEIEDTTLLSLNIKGLFDDIDRRDELWLQAELSVPDPPQLGREYGFETGALGSLTFKGEIAGSDESFKASGNARIGETDLDGTLSGTLTGERPSFSAKLYSPLFRVADLGFATREEGPNVPSRPASEEAPGEFIFGESPIPFDVLERVDLDFDLLLEDVEGIHTEINKVEGRLVVTEGALDVDPLSFNFVGGRVDLSLQADVRGNTPDLRLGIVADDVSLGDFLTQTNVDVPLAGELDLLADLKSSGQSPRELAASLEGDFDMAIERGQVLTSLLDLTTGSPLSWVFSTSTRRGYSEMNCLILRFDIQDGIASSRTLLLDTPNVLAMGEGRIDLREETIDIRVDPQAKRSRLIELTTPFAIQGPLRDPSVDVSSSGAAARAAGEVILSPLNVLGSLLPFVSDRGSDEENPCLVLRTSPVTP